MDGRDVMRQIGWLIVAVAIVSVPAVVASPKGIVTVLTEWFSKSADAGSPKLAAEIREKIVDGKALDPTEEEDYRKFKRFYLAHQLKSSEVVLYDRHGRPLASPLEQLVSDVRQLVAEPVDRLILRIMLSGKSDWTAEAIARGVKRQLAALPPKKG